MTQQAPPRAHGPDDGAVTRGEFNELRDALFGSYSRYGVQQSRGAIGEINDKLDELIRHRGVLTSNISRAFWGALGVVFAAVMLAALHLANPQLP